VSNEASQYVANQEHCQELALELAGALERFLHKHGAARQGDIVMAIHRFYISTLDTMDVQSDRARPCGRLALKMLAEHLARHPAVGGR
jgi:hypothetical protein